MIKSNSRNVVIGAGPAGIAMVGRLLDARAGHITWIDSKFEGGHLVDFPCVPSNTRAELFTRFAEECQCFRDCFEAADFCRAPALSVLRNLPGDKGCELSHAVNVLAELTGLLISRFPTRIAAIKGNCTRIDRDSTNHTYSLSITKSYNKEKVEDNIFVVADRIFLAHGAQPRSPLSKAFPSLDPECALKTPKELEAVFNPNDIVGIVGSSHSAILMIKNISEMSPEQRPKMVINVFRDNLCYAIYGEDGVIEWDNCGLKGDAADWARTNLSDREGQCTLKDSKLCVDRRQNTNNDIDRLLKECTKVIWAIGYETNPTPKGLYVAGHDDVGRLLDANGLIIPNCYGLGIAYPLMVREGKKMVGSVGMWKFMVHSLNVIKAIENIREDGGRISSQF